MFVASPNTRDQRLIDETRSPLLHHTSRRLIVKQKSSSRMRPDGNTSDRL